MFLLHLAAEREIPATVSITADTGSEKDRVCSNGQRMTAREFYDGFVVPYAESHGIEPIFARSVDANKQPLPDIIDLLRSSKSSEVFEEMISSISVPLFTNDRTRGRLLQSCTDKWKIRAINQEARRRGITLLRNAIGYHAGECHRLKANYLKDDGGFSIYKPFSKRGEKLAPVKWLEHYYPCIDLGLDRSAIRARLQKVGLPYLITTECDCCPHQDYDRWIMHTPEVLADIASIESRWSGKLFFTSKRIPLLEAIEEMRQERLHKESQGELPGFGCENGAYCGI